MRDDAILILSQQHRLLVLLFQKIKGTKYENSLFTLIVTNENGIKNKVVLNIFIFQRKILCQCKAPNYLRTCTHRRSSMWKIPSQISNTALAVHIFFFFSKIWLLLRLVTQRREAEFCPKRTEEIKTFWRDPIALENISHFNKKEISFSYRYIILKQIVHQRFVTQQLLHW